MLLATLIIFCLFEWAHLQIYRYYTRPVSISVKAITKEVVNLDRAGLDMAVSSIKDKEVMFNQYLKQKVQITDPAQ